MNEDPTAIRRRRIELGLNQTELAARAGVSKSHLSDVERGVPGKGFSPKNLKALAEALGCESVYDILLPDTDRITDTPPAKSVA